MCIPSDRSDDVGLGDIEYEILTRNALDVLLEQEEAALYGQGLGNADIESLQWRRDFLCVATCTSNTSDERARAAGFANSVGNATSCCMPPEASPELELVGKRCEPWIPHVKLGSEVAHPIHLEEMLALHGVPAERLAAHIGGLAAAEAHKAWSRRRHFGMPPRDPSLVLVDSVLSRLAESCWCALQSVLAAVPWLTAHVLACSDPCPPATASAAAIVATASAAATVAAASRALSQPPPPLLSPPPGSWQRPSSGRTLLSPEPSGALPWAGARAFPGALGGKGRLGGEVRVADGCALAHGHHNFTVSASARPSERSRPRVMPQTRAGLAARAALGAPPALAICLQVPRQGMPDGGTRPTSSAATAGGFGVGTWGGTTFVRVKQPSRSIHSNALAPTKRLSDERHTSADRQGWFAPKPSTAADQGLRLPSILSCKGYS
eukprot:Transcript_16292.p1 GENE.Transcript_16292~~Transcript_16292.p1  ORF type:complete len:461 (-),score=5.78 Transcript_16292:88-1398(-)